MLAEKSNMQSAVTAFWMEAAYIALANAACKYLWLRSLLQELNPLNSAEAIPILCDSMLSILLSCERVVMA